jgi:hypothetical protein
LGEVGRSFSPEQFSFSTDQCFNDVMDNETMKKLSDLEKKIDAIYVSTEKTRKYFQWTMIITVVMFVIPVIGLIIVIPMFISNYTSSFQGLL